MQLTAFGARDRGYFDVILCRAPSAATDAQDVGRRAITALPVHFIGVLYSIPVKLAYQERC